MHYLARKMSTRSIVETLPTSYEEAMANWRASVKKCRDELQKAEEFRREMDSKKKKKIVLSEQLVNVARCDKQIAIITENGKKLESLKKQWFEINTRRLDEILRTAPFSN